MKKIRVGSACAAALLAGFCSGCWTHHEIKTESEIKPVHITIDVNVKVDKALDDEAPYLQPRSAPTITETGGSISIQGVSYTGYGYNYSALGSEQARSGTWNGNSASLRSIKYPSRMYAIMDCRDGVTLNRGCSNVLGKWASLANSGFADAIRHQGRINIVFVDGSVREILSSNQLNPYDYSALGYVNYGIDYNCDFGWTGGRWQN